MPHFSLSYAPSYLESLIRLLLIARLWCIIISIASNKSRRRLGSPLLVPSFAYLPGTTPPLANGKSPTQPLHSSPRTTRDLLHCTHTLRGSLAACLTGV